MLEPTRRKFLGFIALSPVAAKATAEETAKELSGINTRGFGTVENYSGPIEDDYKPSLRIKLLRRLLKLGIPEFKKAKMRREARSVYNLNPNIAAMKSTSLVAKVRQQKEQNYRDMERQFWIDFSGPDIDDAAHKFRKEFEFRL